MVKADEETQLTLRLQARLADLRWAQKRLSVESGIVYSTLNDILNGKIPLSAENAAKLAVVPELRATKEELLMWAGVWTEPKPSQKRDVALALFDQLSRNGQDLAIDLLVMLTQRERKG